MASRCFTSITRHKNIRAERLAAFDFEKGSKELNYFIFGEFDSAEEYGSSAPESGLFALSVSAYGGPTTIILIACLILNFKAHMWLVGWIQYIIYMTSF